MEPHIVNFIKTMSPRDRTFYLLMRSYERDLNAVVKQHPLSNEHMRESLCCVAEMYESALLPLIALDNKSPIYDNQFKRNENAEPSSGSTLDHRNIVVDSSNLNIETRRSLNGSQTVPLSKNFDEFAENLGPWASSFSSNSEESVHPEDIVNERTHNNSDLSSNDD